jgi:hypothetical protein
MEITTVNIVASSIFLITILHTFSIKFFINLAHQYPKHKNLFHMLGEVEFIFGFWAVSLIIILFFISGSKNTIDYLNGQRFTEPLFVFVIMVIAASKPILDFSLSIVKRFSKLIPVNPAVGFYFITMSFIPLLGSLITEPAAMTLAALILRDHFYNKNLSNKLKYATIGTLFVNISIGGVLTPFAAPPILMVASKWNWDLSFVFFTFGWRATLAVFVNSLILTLLFRKELSNIKKLKFENKTMSLIVLIIHLLLLLGVIIFVHEAIIFLGIFLIFLGFASIYQKYQNPLIIKESFMVALFLVGLVILGGQQKWWLQTLLTQLSVNQIFYGATALTAITDNAALTYLGSLVEGLSDEFKYALAAGAVTGGGLTVIANAPNPSGYSILSKKFDNKIISPLYLFISASLPTIVAIICFKFL